MREATSCSRILWVARSACGEAAGSVAGDGGHVREERFSRPAHRGRVGRTLTSAARGELSGYRGVRRRGGRIHAPMCACRPQSANRAHSTPMLRMGCARVLAARHDALATRLGRVKLTRPRAVRCAHSARTRTWVGRGGGLRSPSANRETLPSRSLMLPAYSDMLPAYNEVGRTRRNAVCFALETRTALPARRWDVRRAELDRCAHSACIE